MIVIRVKRIMIPGYESHIIYGPFKNETDAQKWIDIQNNFKDDINYVEHEIVQVCNPEELD